MESARRRTRCASTAVGGGMHLCTTPKYMSISLIFEQFPSCSLAITVLSTSLYRTTSWSRGGGATEDDMRTHAHGVSPRSALTRRRPRPATASTRRPR